MNFLQFHSPTKIIRSPGIAQSADGELAQYSGKTALLITDKVMVSLGWSDKLEKMMSAAGIRLGGIFADVPQDSDVAVVAKAAEIGRGVGAQLIVAVGGGSVIDTAKAVNILLVHGGDIRGYQGYQLLTEALLPLIAVPTTIGTGSEVTPIAVIADQSDMRKLSFVERFIAPDMALLDPEITYSLPAGVAAATAMDALTHALESYTCLEHNAISDMYALAAIKMILGSIVTGTSPDFHPEARSELQLASTLAGVAFSNSMVGGVHSLAHALGGVTRVPHGVANSMVLTAMLRYNLDVISGRLAQISRGIGISRSSNDHESAENLLQFLDETRAILHQQSGLPLRLSDVGVTEDQFVKIANRAMEDGSVLYNPKELTHEAFTEILKEIS